MLLCGFGTYDSPLSAATVFTLRFALSAQKSYMTEYPHRIFQYQNTIEGDIASNALNQAKVSEDSSKRYSNSFKQADPKIQKAVARYH